MTIKHVAIPLILALLVACDGSSADYDQQPEIAAPPPVTPSNMDLMCAEAIEEMRLLLEMGDLHITGRDPRGQLASLVETCIKEGRGGDIPNTTFDLNSHKLDLAMEFLCLEHIPEMAVLMMEHELEGFHVMLTADISPELATEYVAVMQFAWEACKAWGDNANQQSTVGK